MQDLLPLLHPGIVTVPLNRNDLLQASFVDIDTISLENKQIICLTSIDNQILQ